MDNQNGQHKQHHCVPKLMTQSQIIDVFIEYVLTLMAHLPGNVLEMSTNCDGYPHHMIISFTSYTFTNDCERIISWGTFLV